jgi:hypothetical protein
VLWKEAYALLWVIKARTRNAVQKTARTGFVGSCIYHRLEDWTWVESFYFTVVTLSTVGYGDLHPTTPASQLFTALFILTGVAIALSALGIIGSTYLSRREKKIVLRRSKGDGSGEVGDAEEA